MPRLLVFAIAFCIGLSAHAAVVGADPFEQEVDHVYATIDGKDFYMDIFRPTGENRHDFFEPTDGGEGLGIIDVVSGGWNTSRARLEEHKGFQVFGILAARGYTVFAVRPGTKGEHTFAEMLDHIHHAIRYIKSNAEEYDIDPDRLGIMGASAGGHLASLTGLQPRPAEPDADDPLLHHDTSVAAVGAFFPPTDFIDWDDEERDVGETIGELLFRGGIEGKSEEEVTAARKEFSPLYQAHGDAPPFFLIHGDADTVVPLSHSEKLVKALTEQGAQADLLVKEDGGHPWLSLPQEIIKLANWFDEALAE